MGRIIKLFLLTFSFVSLARSAVSRQATRLSEKVRSKFMTDYFQI
jgi:hypothetical protein